MNLLVKEVEGISIYTTKEAGTKVTGGYRLLRNGLHIAATSSERRAIELRDETITKGKLDGKTNV